MRVGPLVLLLSAVARAGTLDVPGQYPTIQAAIDAAHPGDTVVVQPGSYHEALVLPGFDLTLLAPGGSAVTTIDATGLNASVVSVTQPGVYATLIDGFTITGGTGTPDTFGGHTGGGVYAGGGSLTVRHARITGNTALGSENSAGGGVFGDALLEDCVISDNHASSGGGLFGYFASTLIGCTVSGNVADLEGGGLRGGLTLTDCVISGNSALVGGGLYGFSSGVAWSRVTFSGNSASSGGGCAIVEAIAAWVRNATFIGNQAETGGAVALANNYDMPFSSNAVVNCALLDNVSTGGGPTVASYSAFGNGVSIRSSTLVGEVLAFGAFAYDSILWHMAAPLPADMFVSTSDVEGGWPGTGNISADPLFANLAANDIHLLAASPCRNAASLGSGLEAQTDIDGDPRVLEGHLDMGADEFVDDCNGNGLADWQDLQAGTSADCDGNGVPDECEPFVDCNGNGIRDACDIAAGLSTDCNDDGVPDECQALSDCNANGIPDVCESGDCNGNDVPDVCDILAGTSLDIDGNGKPDECYHFIHVPSEQPTLQAAVDAASWGDTILVEPGVHDGPGNRDVLIKKPLLIMGTSDAAECVIDAESLGPIFTIGSPADVVTLRELTLRNGRGPGGGAVNVGSGSLALQLTVRDCILLDNDGMNQPGGAVHVDQGADVELVGCVLAGNMAGSGGALAVLGAGSTATVSHCTFSGNSAVGAGVGAGKGGTLRVRNGAMAMLRDSILVGGTAVSGAEINAQDPDSIVDVAWCDVAGGQAGVVLQGGATLAWGEGNLDADPLFKDEAADDFHLSGGSACIDSGDPSAPPDADGTPPDMGALPFQPFEDLGHALAGALGAPQLSGAGTAIASEALTITLTGAAPSGGATLVLGSALLAAPFKGGVVVPALQSLVGPLVVGADGTLALKGRWPVGLPSGFLVFAQVWLPDPGGPAGYAASNGLSIEAR